MAANEGCFFVSENRRIWRTLEAGYFNSQTTCKRQPQQRQMD